MGRCLEFCVDIDGTLCTLTEIKNYHFAKPKTDMINSVNKLYEHGHHIKIFTARGMVSGTDYKGLTERQLKEWGVKYHELIMGKPSADVYLDDKACTPFAFINVYNKWIED